MQQRLDEAAKARLLLVAISFAWGLNWPTIKIGLESLSPWTYRLIGFTISAGCLLALVLLQGRSLRVPRGWIWLHIMVASALNIVAFGLFSTFAPLTASTSRVAVVTYSFPVWASLLAWLVLGERLSRNAVVGLVLCVCGMAILVYPVLQSEALIGLGLSLACAMTWAVTTIYLKLIRLPGDLVITTWQIIFALFVMAILVPIFHGPISFGDVSLRSMLAVAFSGVIGTGMAYAMWYRVIEHLPAATASIGVLAVPVIGVISSAILLGERPTPSDMIGFTLIFLAACCVIIQPRDRTPAAAQ